jgi:SAM-dependent methyltransferase
MTRDSGNLDDEGYVGQPLQDASLCPVCRSASSKARPTVTINPHASVDVVLRKCRRCRHMWIDPMPTQGFLTHLYTRGSRSVVGIECRTGENVLSWPEQLVADAINGDGKYLELGVGAGILFNVMQSRGWICRGVEPGASRLEIAGVEGALEDLEDESPFDVVVAIDVLEHISDPREALSRLRRMIAPQGELFGSFPRSTSLRGMLQGSGWRMVRPFGHVHYFSKSSARKILASAGFDLVDWRTSDLSSGETGRFRSRLALMIERLGLGDQAWFRAVPTDSAS